MRSTSQAGDWEENLTAMTVFFDRRIYEEKYDKLGLEIGFAYKKI